MGQVLLFSLTAMFNPTLLAVTTLMLLLQNPKRLMLGYLLGAYLTSITLGLLIVFALEGNSVVNTSKRTVNPAADLAIGAILLVVALVLGTGRQEPYVERRRERKNAKGEKKPPFYERALSKGSARIAFALGVILTLPGASYLAALTSLSKLDYSTTVTVLLVVVINVIMLALLEIPLASFAIAPEWTPAAVERSKAWFSRHALKAATFGAALVGTLLVLRGVLTLAAS